MTLATPLPTRRLSSTALARLRSELAALSAERVETARNGSDTQPGADVADLAQLAERDMALAQLDERIARVRSHIATAEEGVVGGASDEPQVPGAALPGSWVSLRFGTDDTAEAYLLADLEERGPLPVVTLGSPLGQALLGASSGATVTYQSPAGRRTVEVVEVGSADLD
jgi:transcription elongation factor GreA